LWRFYEIACPTGSPLQIRSSVTFPRFEDLLTALTGGLPCIVAEKFTILKPLFFMFKRSRSLSKFIGPPDGDYILARRKDNRELLTQLDSLRSGRANRSSNGDVMPLPGSTGWPGTPSFKSNGRVIRSDHNADDRWRSPAPPLEVDLMLCIRHESDHNLVPHLQPVFQYLNRPKSAQVQSNYLTRKLGSRGECCKNGNLNYN
jgi:hypothetical protein